MCDYSLHGMPNRLAEEGEVLVVHRFLTGSKGLTSPEYLKPTEKRSEQPKPKGLMAIFTRKCAAPSSVCVVCIPDGAKLVLHGISPTLQRTHGFSPSEAVTFRQLAPDAHAYRDAVEFKNGVRVRLQELEEGQNIEVWALSSEKPDGRDEKRMAVPV